ncbi:MAG TPA: alkaline phosphatase D family protein, partial [Mycobacteriales bacterium]|nr:alkaline phosphatase D family protein [Mycobacteriales bacterium]
EASDPARTITGAKQMDWLLTGLDRSTARWNVIANQVMMAEQRTSLADPPPVNMDAWDGYPADRQKLFDGVLEQRVDGLVVITGDTHTNYASDLKQNFDDMNSPTVGVEFVGTSISSGRDGSDSTPGLELALEANPHIKFDNFQRGYVACEIDRDTARADYRIVPYVTERGAPISTRASFVSERLNPGLEAV